MTKQLTSSEPEFFDEWYEQGIESQDVEGEPIGNPAYMAWMEQVLTASTDREIDWARVGLAVVVDRMVRRDELRRATEKVEACGDKAAPGWRGLNTETWTPCALDKGHRGPHWSTSGCAGGEVSWGPGVSPWPPM